MYTTKLFYNDFHHKLQFSFYLELENQKEDGKRVFLTENFDRNIHIETGVFLIKVSQ